MKSEFGSQFDGGKWRSSAVRHVKFCMNIGGENIRYGANLVVNSYKYDDDVLVMSGYQI